MSATVDSLVGLTAPRALSALLSTLPEVDVLQLAVCRPYPPLQARRELTAAEQTVFDRALALRLQTGISFWDAALLQLPALPEAVGLLDEATVHVSFRGKERAMTRASVISGDLERACSEFSEGQAGSLTLLSEVICRDGSRRHLPMIDFHAFKSNPNQRIVEAVAERLFPGGALILDSGESYHGYGTQLLSDIDFRRFLAGALLFSPIVDRAYVAHQFMEGRCALRLTAGGGKARVPTVVAMLPER